MKIDASTVFRTLSLGKHCVLTVGKEKSHALRRGQSTGRKRPTNPKIGFAGQLEAGTEWLTRYSVCKENDTLGV